MLNSPSAHPFASLLLPFLKLRSAAIARKMVGVSPTEYAELWARLEELGELALLLSPPEFPGDDVRYVSFERRRREVVTEFPALVEVPAEVRKGEELWEPGIKAEWRWIPDEYGAVASIRLTPELREKLGKRADEFKEAQELRTVTFRGSSKDAAMASAVVELRDWITETTGAESAVQWDQISEEIEILEEIGLQREEESRGMVAVHGEDAIRPDPPEIDDDLRNRVVKEWNELHPVGTRVRYRNPTARPGVEAPTSIATTRTPAEVLQYPVSPGKTGKAVVWVSDCSIPIPLEDVEVVETWGKCPLSAPGGCRRVACWESGKCQAGNVAVGGGAQ